MMLIVRDGAGTFTLAEAEYLDSDGNKTPFSFRVGLSLFLPTVLGMTAVFSPKSRWFQLCQCVLSQVILCYLVRYQSVFARSIFFLDYQDMSCVCGTEHTQVMGDGARVLLGAWGSATNEGNVIASLFSCCWISDL